jgi:IPT/TIG domain
MRTRLCLWFGVAILVCACPLAASRAAQGSRVPGPTITRIAPRIGPAGTVVEIDGSGFTYATRVTSGGHSAAFTVDNDTTMHFIVPEYYASASRPMWLWSTLPTAMRLAACAQRHVCPRWSVRPAMARAGWRGEVDGDQGAEGSCFCPLDDLELLDRRTKVRVVDVRAGHDVLCPNGARPDHHARIGVGA